ncbi:GTPase ObgE [Patescibacteria group bacterium]|nr:GTPase ObgE [Patescibacteria group bacterium]
MAFIDEIKIKVKAGNGGDGVVRWLHTRETELGGPSGGDGGRGGDVYAKALRDVHLLSRYRAKKEAAAENGKDGQAKNLFGANGKDLDLLLPVGSIITNIETDEKFSLNEEGERILLLSGGSGGRGNRSFKSSRNQAPDKATPGKPGQTATFYIEVELIAHIGLIGLPNAGKTSLLNELTSAHGKVGNYPFTTLEPNLGEMYGYIIADIPGLVEGAAKGKGLGHKFLRHIKRTKILLHVISLENSDVLEAYQTVRKEIEQYDPELLKKREIILLTKTDLKNEAEVKEAQKKLKKISSTIYAVSLYEDEDMKLLEKLLLKELSNTATS